MRLKTESGTTLVSGHAGVGVVRICLDTSLKRSSLWNLGKLTDQCIGK